MGNTFSESIEMTAELEQIFNSIYSNSMHSSAELFQKYMNDRPEYKNDFLKYQMQVSTFQQQISSLRSQYSNMSDIDFFKEYVSQYSRSVIDKMKEEYEDQLSQEQLQRLNNFNLEVVNNPDFKQDMTAFPEQSRVSINMPYLRGNDVVEKIIFAIGIIPHELIIM